MRGKGGLGEDSPLFVVLSGTHNQVVPPQVLLFDPELYCIVSGHERGEARDRENVRGSERFSGDVEGERLVSREDGPSEGLKNHVASCFSINLKLDAKLIDGSVHTVLKQSVGEKDRGIKSLSAKLRAIPQGNPEAILRDARKKARAEVRGLSADTRPRDTDLSANLNAYSFSAINSVIANQQPSPIQAVEPSKLIHVPISDPAYPILTPPPTTLPQPVPQTSLPTSPLPTDIKVEAIKRIP